MPYAVTFTKILSAFNRQKNKNIQPGQEKQYSCIKRGVYKVP